MSKTSPEDVRKFLTSFLVQKLNGQERGLANDLPDDCDLLLTGMIDSLGFAELIAAAAQHFGREVDFEGLDPEKMTIVGPLCQFMSEQLDKV